MPFAGPLIRIIGDRFAWEVKAAILHTLGLLIGKAGTGLKPFVPQLQTTFMKCLGDQVMPALPVNQMSAFMPLFAVCAMLGPVAALATEHPDLCPGGDCPAGVQARQVRQSAAQNLGEVTKMSLRVDQLASDLTNHGRAAEPALAEAYLTALKGMLASVGDRLSPAVLSGMGSAMQDLMASAGGHLSILSSYNYSLLGMKCPHDL
jgi:hypothetical protein